MRVQVVSPKFKCIFSKDGYIIRNPVGDFRVLKILGKLPDEGSIQICVTSGILLLRDKVRVAEQ